MQAAACWRVVVVMMMMMMLMMMIRTRRSETMNQIYSKHDVYCYADTRHAPIVFHHCVCSHMPLGGDAM